MQRTLQLTWNHVEPSEAVAELVKKQVGRLERYFGRITGCAVTLETRSRHHRQSGSMYRVRIELEVPGGRLVVGRDPDQGTAHEDLYAAVNAAFREARRQLLDHARRTDHRVKAHETRRIARVAQLFPAGGYGFLRTPDGRDIYFHARSVLHDGFRRLQVGSVVRFAEELGDEGPQASTVAALHRRVSAERAEGGGAP